MSSDRAIAMLFFAWSAIMVYTGHEWGYASAREDYSRPVKYRCHEGVVYRNTSGYWEDLKQSCKTLEQIK